jgi:hypothetical protein
LWALSRFEEFPDEEKRKATVGGDRKDGARNVCDVAYGE